MVCPKCGAPLPDGSTFCPNCGVSLAISQQPYAQPQQQYAQPQQQYAQPQQQYAQPQQQYAQPQQQYAQPQQQYAQPQQQYAQPQQQYGQPQQQYAQPQQQYAQPQQQYAQPQQPYAQPQQPYAQPQQQYGQPQPQYGQPQYAMPYGGAAPAKKSNTGLIIGIIAGSVVVIAGIVILLIFLLGGVHGKPYTAKLTINGATTSFDGTYSGGWKEDPGSSGGGKPEGNGTLESKMTVEGVDLNCKVSGNWKDGKLNGDNCSLTASGSNPDNPAETMTLDISGKFADGNLTDGSYKMEAITSEGSKMVVTATVENGRQTDYVTKYYDKDGKEFSF